MPTETATEVQRPISPALSPRMLTVLLAATFITTFDFFVVNVAAPSMQHDLHAAPAELELVVGGYAFAYASALILGGRLGDLLGHRTVFAVGMAGFLATSTLCGIAPGPIPLVLARLAQGLAAAVMMPQVLAIISRNTTASERARAMAWFGAAGGAGSVTAQVFGGFLVTADVAGLGWRLIFLINIPLGLIGTFAAPRVLPRDTGRAAQVRRQLDLVSAVGFALGMGLLLVPMALGRSAGWPLWTWVSMLTAPAVFGLTVTWQRAFARRGGRPLLDLTLWRARSFRLGVSGSFAFMAYFASYMFTLALLLQEGLRLSAFNSGLVFAPAGIAFSASAMLAPRLVARFATKALVAGGVLTVAGLVLLATLTMLGGSHSSVLAITAVAALISLGNGIVMPSLIGATLHDVPAPQAGAAAGALTTAQQFAGAAGVAVIGTIYFAAAHSGAGGAMAWAATLEAVLMIIVVATIVAAGRGAADRHG